MKLSEAAEEELAITWRCSLNSRYKDGPLTSVHSGCLSDLLPCQVSKDLAHNVTDLFPHQTLSTEQAHCNYTVQMNLPTTNESLQMNVAAWMDLDASHNLFPQLDKEQSDIPGINMADLQRGL